MIKFIFKYTEYVYVRTHVMQSASARHIIHERFRCILFAPLLFSHEALPKCRENYGDSLSAIYGIYDVTLRKFYSYLLYMFIL